MSQNSDKSVATHEATKKLDPRELVRLDNFVEHVLQFENLYPWQKKIFKDVDRKWQRTAARVCNGSGKTSRIAVGSALWNMLCNQGSTTVCTSAVMRQVKEQFLPNFKMVARARGLEAAGMKITQEGAEWPKAESRLVAFTCNDAGLFEGFHRSGPSDSLLIIVDEAKSVKEDIFQAIERCQPDRLLLISSAGKPAGAFWRAFEREAEFWNRHTITSFDCPHISPQWIDMQIRKWGRQHPLIRSMIFSEWMADEGEQLVIDPDALERLISDPPRHRFGPRTAGLDFAAGGDENVICIAEGNKVIHLHGWREVDTMKAAAVFVGTLQKFRVRPENTFADAGGIGRPVVDAMTRMGFSPTNVNFGSKASYVDAYYNRATEMWYNLRHLIEHKSIIIPEDEDLRQQLIIRRWETNELNGKIMLESKKKLRARGIESPDRADALALCFSTQRASKEGIVEGDPAIISYDFGAKLQEYLNPDPMTGLAESLGISTGG